MPSSSRQAPGKISQEQSQQLEQNKKSLKQQCLCQINIANPTWEEPRITHCDSPSTQLCEPHPARYPLFQKPAQKYEQLLLSLPPPALRQLLLALSPWLSPVTTSTQDPFLFPFMTKETQGDTSCFAMEAAAFSPSHYRAVLPPAALFRLDSS